MWIIIRLVVLVAGFLIRYTNIFRKKFKFSTPLQSGKMYAVQTSTHKGKVVAYYLGVELETDTVFEITRESSFNRFLKSVGFASEIQTGDIAFDEKFYVGSDHFHFNRALREDPVIRGLIHDIVAKSYLVESIICDGHTLYIKSKAVIEPHVELVQMLHELGEKIKPIAKTSKFQAYKDPFIFKLLIFESVLFALMFYAFEVFIEMVMVDQYSLVTPFKAYIPGTITGLIIVGILTAVFYKFFRESARSHFVFIANAFILLFSMPFWGTKTFIDFNRSLDKSPVSTEKIVVERKEIVVTRSRKGGKNYTYYWHYRLPYADSSERLSVPRDIYNSVSENDEVEIKMRNGAFDYPYRISINNIEL